MKTVLSWVGIFVGMNVWLAGFMGAAYLVAMAFCWMVTLVTGQPFIVR